MARISLNRLRQLVKESVDSKQDGWASPEDVLDISLGETHHDSDAIIDQSTAGQTLTYEGHEVTVVLDFDDKGYLTNIEFV